MTQFAILLTHQPTHQIQFPIVTTTNTFDTIREHFQNYVYGYHNFTYVGPLDNIATLGPTMEFGKSQLARWGHTVVLLSP